MLQAARRTPPAACRHLHTPGPLQRTAVKPHAHAYTPWRTCAVSSHMRCLRFLARHSALAVAASARRCSKNLREDSGISHRMGCRVGARVPVSREAHAEEPLKKEGSGVTQSKG